MTWQADKVIDIFQVMKRMLTFKTYIEVALEDNTKKFAYLLIVKKIKNKYI